MTSLKVIIISKFNKSKRQKHIAQMERDMGLPPSMRVDDEREPPVSPTKYELHRKDREKAYKNIENILHGYYFTDAGTAKDIHSKYRNYDGTLFLYWDQKEIDLLNCSFQFINECMETLEYAGYVVNVLDMERIKFLCPGIELKKSEFTNQYETRNVTEMRRFFDGAQFEDGMEGIDLDTVKQYRKINECFNPEFRVELSEMRGVPYAVIRTIDGGIRTHIYLTMNYATVVIYGNRHEFSDVKNKLENMGYVVKYGPENCYDFKCEPF